MGCKAWGGVTMFNYASRDVNCPHCGCFTRVVMHLQYGTNNRCWVCQICGQSVSHKVVCDGKGHWIPKDFMASIDNTKLPVHRPTHVRLRRCAVCGADGAELHHFAPRAFFGKECERWPKAYLCRTCHRCWHELVTPGLIGSQPVKQEEYAW